MFIMNQEKLENLIIQIKKENQKGDLTLKYSVTHNFNT